MAAFPDRFFGYFMVNPLAEGALERAQIALRCGLHAICLFPAMHRYSMQDPRAEAAHPGRRPAIAGAPCSSTAACSPWASARSWDCPRPSTCASPIRSICTPWRCAIRSVKFIVPHFGAGYFREALMLADLCPNVYLDTSSSNSWMRYEGIDLKTVFRRALDVVGAQRLLFGTDSSFFPRGWNYEIFEAQTRAFLDLGVSATDARLMLEENLVRIFADAG